MACEEAGTACVGVRVLVVGGSPEAPGPDLLRRLVRAADAVVAVDHGLDALLAAGCRCDVFCGDADSVSPAAFQLVAAAEDTSGAGGTTVARGEPGAEGVPTGADAAPGAPGRIGAVERYNPAKDYTDLSLALRAVRTRWSAARLTCTGLAGGRPDHALAALGQLASWGSCVAWEEEGFSGRILHAGEAWELADVQGRTFSFVPLASGTVVSEQGMRWLLDHRRTELLSDLGISNVIEAPLARIVCHEGALAAWCLR